MLQMQKIPDGHESLEIPAIFPSDGEIMTQLHTDDPGNGTGQVRTRGRPPGERGTSDARHLDRRQTPGGERIDPA
jgi:hypothetical protein